MTLNLMFNELTRNKLKGNYYLNSAIMAIDKTFLKVGVFMSADFQHIAIVKYLYGKITVQEM